MRQSMMDLSIEPEAIYWPEGSKRAAKTSPEWPGICQHGHRLGVGGRERPASSIMGACSPLVRGT